MQPEPAAIATSMRALAQRNDRQTTAHRIGGWIQKHRPAIVDLTGGAPEISSSFCYLGRSFARSRLSRNRPQ